MLVLPSLQLKQGVAALAAARGRQHNRHQHQTGHLPHGTNLREPRGIVCRFLNRHKTLARGGWCANATVAFFHPLWRSRAGKADWPEHLAQSKRKEPAGLTTGAGSFLKYRKHVAV